MPESPQKQRVPKSDRRGVFRQGGSPPRVGLYARVSTHDQQTLPLQLSAMREHAERRGWAVVLDVEDVGSESVNDSLFVGLSIALALGRYVTPFRGDLASFSPDHA